MGVRTGHGWTFLTNHARILAAVARNPNARIRDIAAECRLTERTAQAILSDLEQGGYLTQQRTGRRNTYHVTPGTRLCHPADPSTRRPVDQTLDFTPDDTTPDNDKPDSTEPPPGQPGAGTPPTTVEPTSPATDRSDPPQRPSTATAVWSRAPARTSSSVSRR